MKIKRRGKLFCLEVNQAVVFIRRTSKVEVAKWYFDKFGKQLSLDNIITVTKQGKSILKDLLEYEKYSHQETKIRVK